MRVWSPIAVIAALFLLVHAVSAEWVPVSSGLQKSGETHLLEDSGAAIRVSFTFAGYDAETVMADGIECIRIGVPGMAPTLVQGEPELPIWTRSVIVADKGHVSLRVISEEWEEVLSRPVLPSKGNLPRSINPRSVPFEFGATYETDEWSPSEAAMLSDPFILRDFRGVTVVVHPIRYNGARGMLRICREITVEIRTGGTGGLHEKSRARSKLSREFSCMYEQMFLNHIRDAHPISEHAGRMLIITADQFYDDMASLVTWKVEKGIDTKLVKYSEIGGTGASAVKSCIQDEYDGPGVTFVLLVGDKEHIPTFSFSDGEADPMYSLLEGGDVYPDAFISRFSVQSSGDVQTMGIRSIDYELSPTVATDWYHKATGIASSEGSPTDWQWMDGFRDKILAYYYTEMDQIYDPGASSSEVTSALNNGRSLVLYMGHGSTTAWGTTGFSVSNINALTNDSMLPVVSCVACFNGDFSYNNCFGEAWLRATHDGQPTGAIASYASSIGQSWVPPQYGQQGLVDSLVNDRYNTVGGLLFMGSVAMLEHYAGGYEAQDIFNTWIIFGDCSVQMRTDAAVSMPASYPATVPVGTQAVDISIPGVSGALAAFSQNGELLGSGYTDAAGNVHVTLNEAPTVPGSMKLTITAYNRIPIVEDILIIAPDGPYVIYADNTILGDGQADVGDEISLDVTLENVGTEPAFAVQGTLSTVEVEIQMGDSVQSYGDIDAGNSAVSQSPYTFEIGSLADQTSVPFALSIGSGDSLWLGAFNITIHAPILSQNGWTMDDAAGNSNGQADPGETVGLTVAVHNSGSGIASDAELTLDDSDPYVAISGPATQDLGQIPAGGQVYSPSFTLSFDESCPEAYASQIPLTFVSNGGAYTASGSLTLVVGQRELLYVDSDNENTETRITAALDAWGRSYVRWNTYEPGNAVVPLDTLRSYRMVLWASGDQNNSSITADNRINLASYLDEGGALLFSGENYLSAYAADDFTSDYLHVASHTISISGSQVVGEAGDPISDGMSVTLSYPAGLSQYPDRINPDAEAAVVFRMQENSFPVVIRYPASGSAAYRMLFFGVPLEAFPSGRGRNDIETVVSNCLSWLSGGGDIIAPTIPGDAAFASDGTLSWSASTDNVGVDHYCIYRSSSAHFNVQGMAPVRTSTGTSELFGGSVGDPGTNYYFRVAAKDAAGNESPPSSTVGEHDYATER